MAFQQSTRVHLSHPMFPQHVQPQEAPTLPISGFTVIDLIIRDLITPTPGRITSAFDVLLQFGNGSYISWPTSSIGYRTSCTQGDARLRSTRMSSYIEEYCWVAAILPKKKDPAWRCVCVWDVWTDDKLLVDFHFSKRRGLQGMS